MYKIFIQSQKGSVAIMSTMMMLFAILLIVTMFSNIVNMSIRISKEQLDSTKTYYAAEAGAEKILWEARKNKLIEDGILSTTDCEVCYDNSNVLLGLVKTPAANGCASSCGGANVQNLASGTSYTIDYDYEVGTTTLTIKGFYENVRRTIDISW